MATPRSRLIDDKLSLHYHLISRCVRRSWLCGRNSGKNYDHRKQWLKSRMFHLAKYFAVDVDAYTIMSNHFHLVVFYDPLACNKWSDSEVAYRWTEAFPPRLVGHSQEELELRKQWQRDSLLESPERLASARVCLGSLSAFMKHLKQPIAWRANREDKCTGHFFEGRFYSGALLCEEAVLAAMAYVDLNPVRAKIANSIEQCSDSSIAMRLQMNSPERLREALVPLVSGTTHPRPLTMTLGDYIKRLRLLTDEPESSQRSEAEHRWFASVAAIRRRQRAYGLVDELKDWVMRHRYKRIGHVLPG
jgi:REP element-mobilizing transposase RayT